MVNIWLRITLIDKQKARSAPYIYSNTHSQLFFFGTLKVTVKAVINRPYSINNN